MPSDAGLATPEGVTVLCPSSPGAALGGGRKAAAVEAPARAISHTASLSQPAP